MTNDKNGLGLTKPEDFYYLTGNGRGGQALEIPGKSDADECKEMMDGFESLKFSDAWKKEIAEGVAAVLHLGNINFQEGGGGHAEFDGSKTNADKHLEIAAKGMGVSNDALKARLLTRSIKVGMETIAANLNVQDAIENRLTFLFCPFPLSPFAHAHTICLKIGMPCPKRYSTECSFGSFNK